LSHSLVLYIVSSILCFIYLSNLHMILTYVMVARFDCLDIHIHSVSDFEEKKELSSILVYCFSDFTGLFGFVTWTVNFLINKSAAR
jgi:hypothetical protein